MENLNGWNVNIKKTTDEPYTLNYYDNASIIYNTSHSAHANNEQAIGGSTFNKDYNFWHDTEAYDVDFVGANDVVGDPVLGKTSGWESLADEPTAANLALGATSDLIDAAQASSFPDRIDPDSDFTTSPPSAITMTGDEIGAMGYEQPDPDGETGLYNVLGGTKQLTLGGTKQLTLSGE